MEKIEDQVFGLLMEDEHLFFFLSFAVGGLGGVGGVVGGVGWGGAG